VEVCDSAPYPIRRQEWGICCSSLQQRGAAWSSVEQRGAAWSKSAGGEKQKGDVGGVEDFWSREIGKQEICCSRRLPAAAWSSVEPVGA
jgi:hypothetical protein